MQNDNTQRPVYLNLLKIKLPVTAILSILHRITGVFMVISLPFLVYLLDLSLSSEEGFATVTEFLAQPLVRLLLALYLWFLLHHLLAGIRFLLLDVDVGVERSMARRSAFLVNYLGVALFITLLLGVFSL